MRKTRKEGEEEGREYEMEKWKRGGGKERKVRMELIILQFSDFLYS